MINTKLDTSYEPSSAFRDAFSRVMAAPQVSTNQNNILNATSLDTQLGQMLAIASEDALYLLEFVDRRRLERQIERVRQKTKSAIIRGKTEQIIMIEEELTAYFKGTLTEFKTPIQTTGSAFQQSVWNELTKIPRGETRSYIDIAIAIGRPSAARAVAQAIGSNPLAIIIPCHRVINKSGKLGGYASGIERKKWLLHHERQFS